MDTADIYGWIGVIFAFILGRWMEHHYWSGPKYSQKIRELTKEEAEERSRRGRAEQDLEAMTKKAERLEAEVARLRAEGGQR